MNSPQAIENQNIVELPCLLIPLKGRFLLLPTVTVAEMAPYMAVRMESNTPDWYLGVYHWRDQAVPLLSFEVINGEANPLATSSSRIAVLNNTRICDSLPFIALVTQGIPRLARVNAEEISEISTADKKPFELMHVSIAGETAVIPDIDALESAYLDFRYR